MYQESLVGLRECTRGMQAFLCVLCITNSILCATPTLLCLYKVYSVHCAYARGSPVTILAHSGQRVNEG